MPKTTISSSFHQTMMMVQLGLALFFSTVSADSGGAATATGGGAGGSGSLTSTGTTGGSTTDPVLSLLNNLSSDVQTLKNSLAGSLSLTILLIAILAYLVYRQVQASKLAATQQSQATFATNQLAVHTTPLGANSATQAQSLLLSSLLTPPVATSSGTAATGSAGASSGSVAITIPSS